jgi:hypothetical protein
MKSVFTALCVAAGLFGASVWRLPLHLHRRHQKPPNPLLPLLLRRLRPLANPPRRK